jgi:hypothetical protein
MSVLNNHGLRILQLKQQVDNINKHLFPDDKIEFFQNVKPADFTRATDA